MSASGQPLLASLPLFRRGKVRDTYDLGDYLLMVASDRISAFDVVLPTPIPGKGRILNRLSQFWLELTPDLVPNHLVPADVASSLDLNFRSDLDLASRSMLIRKAERIDIECVVRGCLAGSGWAEYARQGTLAGLPLRPGLRQAERLDEPVFTPAIKNDVGHDENIAVSRLIDTVGTALASDLERTSLALYRFAAKYALDRDIILADTKFEFGFIDGELTLIDEVFTPDSSRFWDVATYEPGRDQASFDKQPLRDWLIDTGWNKEPPAPELPPSVVQETRDRYLEAYRRLTGEQLDLGGTSG